MLSANKIGKILRANFTVNTEDRQLYCNSRMKQIIISVISDLGLNIIDAIDHEFENQGYTYIGILAESHISFHTWPELNFFTIDIFCCGDYKLDNIGLIMNQYIEIAKSQIEIDDRIIPI